MHSLIARAVVGALFVVLLVAGASSPAVADTDASADPNAETVTWSVRPADEAGEDGRAWVERELDPGEVAVEHAAIRNLSGQDVVFRLSAADGYFRDNGRFSMLSSGEESVDAGTWIDLPEDVAVSAGETAVVSFTITVPDGAIPGDHAAGVAASVLSEQRGPDGAAVGVESRVGFRVMTRVTGELDPAAELDAVTTSYAPSWNPFSPGSAVVSFDVVNTGNTRLLASGSVTAGGGETAFPAPGEVDQELMPSDRRRFSVVVDDVWPWFYVPAAIDAAMHVVGEGEGMSMADTRVKTGIWAMPWTQLAMLVGIGLLVISGLWGRT